jgi:hypothetical protein
VILDTPKLKLTHLAKLSLDVCLLFRLLLPLPQLLAHCYWCKGKNRRRLHQLSNLIQERPANDTTGAENLESSSQNRPPSAHTTHSKATSADLESSSQNRPPSAHTTYSEADLESLFQSLIPSTPQTQEVARPSRPESALLPPPVHSRTQTSCSRTPLAPLNSTESANCQATWV